MMGVKAIRKVTPVLLAGLGEAKQFSFGRTLAARSFPKSFPKSFQRALSRRSLFQDNVLQALHVGAPVIICEERYVSIVRAQLQEIDVCPRSIITEPEHRGAAASVALAAFHLKNKNEAMLVSSAGQPVFDEEEYLSAVDALCPYVEDTFCLFAQTPDTSRAGFGYLDYFPHVLDTDIYKLKRYTPPRHLNADLSGSLVYSGVFIVRPRVYLNAHKSNQGSIYKYVEKSYYSAEKRDGLTLPSTAAFLQIGGGDIECVIMKGLESAYIRVLQCGAVDRSLCRTIRRSVVSIIKGA